MDQIAASVKDSLDDIVIVKDVWDTSLLCELQFVEWRQTLWNDIRTEVMEDGAKGFVKDVKALNKKVGKMGMGHPQHLG